MTRTEYDGTITVLADHYKGKRLNSPNDVVVKSDGTSGSRIPTYGISAEYEGSKAESEIGSCNVYRFDPRDGSLRVVVDDFKRPNGLAFSPDESILYIADSGFWPNPDWPHHIRAFDVSGRQARRTAGFVAEVSPGIPDGFPRRRRRQHLDELGRRRAAASRRRVMSSAGSRFPRRSRTSASAAQSRDRLYICGHTSLYAIHVNARGAQVP